MIYLTCYIASAVCAYYGMKSTDRKKFWILSAVSILLPALLAGLRDHSIGIDTMNYLTLKRYWVGATTYETLGQYMQFYMSIGYGEALFALLTGIVGQIFGNYNVLLFLIHLSIVSCIYIGAYRFRKIVEPAFVLLLFYLVFFSHSLNIMRQYMAMAIIFAALADIPKKKYIRYSLFVILAAQFHTSALLGFGIMAIDFYLVWDWRRTLEQAKALWQKCKALAVRIIPRLAKSRPEKEVPEKPKKNRKITIPVLSRIQSELVRRQVALFSVLSLMVLLFNPLCRLVIHMGLLNKKYLWYLDMSRAEPTILISLFLLVEMAALVFYYKHLQKSISIFPLFFTNSVTYLILHQVSIFLVYGKRVAAYFSLANLITIAMIPVIFRNKKKRRIVYGLVLAVALFYWFYCYILRNASQTYPYRFIFQ